MNTKIVYDVKTIGLSLLQFHMGCLLVGSVTVTAVTPGKLATF